MTLFERYLSLWVFLCIVIGVVLRANQDKAQSRLVRSGKEEEPCLKHWLPLPSSLAMCTDLLRA